MAIFQGVLNDSDHDSVEEFSHRLRSSLFCSFILIWIRFKHHFFISSSLIFFYRGFRLSKNLNNIANFRCNFAKISDLVVLDEALQKNREWRSSHLSFLGKEVPKKKLRNFFPAKLSMRGRPDLVPSMSRTTGHILATWPEVTALRFGEGGRIPKFGRTSVFSIVTT